MHNDDNMIGRLLTRRELVALFGASAVAAMAPSCLRASGASRRRVRGIAGLRRRAAADRRTVLCR